MSDAKKHPMLENFKRDLAKKLVLPGKAREFLAFLNGEKGEPFREEGMALFREYEALGKGASSGLKSGAQASSAQGVKQGGGQGGGHSGGRPSQPQGRPPWQGGGGGGARGGGIGGDRTPRSSEASPPSRIGASFHNPYTFLPFPNEVARAAPTLRTIDEKDSSRVTGVLELCVKTLSPLMTCHGVPSAGGDNEHKTYDAITHRDDVIVPASGVRGALRTLLTVLTGGTLGYVDEAVWLCQGRDLALGPSRALPDGRFDMARIERPGRERRGCRVRLGDVKLVSADTLAARLGGRMDRAPHMKLWCDAGCTSFSSEPNAQHPWRVRLSGRPIKRDGKREALWLEGETDIELPPELWIAYLGRHQHGDVPEPKMGDLVWLERADSNSPVREAKDVRSIQWARWGREGERLVNVIRERHPAVYPDAMRDDGMVDLVTDLFGQVGREDLLPAATATKKPIAPLTFAARVRPDNLVFFDARTQTQQVTLAPLAPPHPGCAAFYRDAPNADAVSPKGLPLRGYKVYRTSVDGEEPWRYSVQGVYGKHGERKPPRQKVNKTAALLSRGAMGTVRIACRALSLRELAALFAAFAVDWRLGGGKPLGLGHCRVVEAVFHDEDGIERYRMRRDTDAIAALPQELQRALDAAWRERMVAWQATQRPVAKLRYPRAAAENREGIQRGGHVWFARHAQLKKSADDRAPVGLEVRQLSDEAQRKVGGEWLAAQPLPRFVTASPDADVLYGYDLFEPDSSGAGGRRALTTLEPFTEPTPAPVNQPRGGDQGQNRERRQDERQRGRR
jgi:hypothetical protein